MAEEATAVADEEEEFQFRRRAEMEASQAPQQPAAQPPSAMSPAEEKGAVVQAAQDHPAIENAAQAAAGFVKSIPAMAESFPKGALEIAKFATGGPQQQGDVVKELMGQAIPMGRQTAADVQSPLGTVESFRGFGTLAMMATPGLELFRELRTPALTEILSKPPVQAGGLHDILFPKAGAESAPITAEVVKPPVQDRQLLVQPEKRFQMVDEPKPEIAPARNIVETARYQPASRPGEESPLASGAFPSISQGAEEARRAARTVETGVQSETARLGGESRPLPEWTKEEMGRRGLNPNRPLNDVDVQNPSVREAVKSDLTLTEPEKQNVLQTGSPEARQGTEAQPVSEKPVLAIRMNDGTIVSDTEARIHADIFERPDVNAADIKDGGVVINGRYVVQSPDAPAAAEAARAKQRVTIKREERLSASRQGTEAQPAQEVAPTSGERPPVQAQYGEPQARGVSQAATEAELGKGSVEPGAGAEIGSGLEHGRDYINKGGDPRLPIRRAETSGMVGKNDVGTVHAELERLRGERSQAAAALEAGPDDPVLQNKFAQADDAQRAWRKELQPVLTKASDSLREAYALSRPNADPSTYQGLADLMDEHFKGQVERTPEMRTEMAKSARGIREGRVIANTELGKVEETLTKQIKSGKVMTPEELHADLNGELKIQFKDCFLNA